jgi:single-strand DNA-binding protein
MYTTQLIGNVGKDAIVNQTTNDKNVINFSVAVNERIKQSDGTYKDESLWFDCAKFGDSIKIADYLKAGQLVYLTGRVSAKAWTAKGGELKTGLALIVDQIELLGGVKAK